MKSLAINILVVFLISAKLLGENKKRPIFSLLGKATTANAGGQDARALRYHNQADYELWLFSNYYLITGNNPLSGLGISKSIDVLSSFPLATNVLLGAGISTAGPMFELVLSHKICKIFRIDLSTHFYFPTERMIIWNYPLWLGFSIHF